MVGLCGIWAVVVWRLGTDPWANVTLFGAGVVVTGVFVWWVRSTQSFAERNPAQAMLEGAEFLEFRKFEAQAKGVTLGSSPKLPDPSKPPLVDLPIIPEE